MQSKIQIIVIMTVPVINEKRMVRLFCDLARIASLSGREGAMVRRLSILLKFMGAEIHIDAAGERTGGETGNLIARFPGTGPGEPFLLCAHMDTVGPADNVRPRIGGGRVFSDGSTILGADCKAGITIIVETLKVLEESRLPHPPVEAVFTVSEEAALMGAKHLDYSRIQARRGLIFDNEKPLECVITEAPAANNLDIKVRGVAAHSGVAPERGISAVKVAARAVAAMKLGRIDSLTTANIGIISGGSAVNIIPPLVELKGEVRSRAPAELKRQTSHMENCLKRAVRSSRVKAGGKILRAGYEFLVERKFPALAVPRTSPALGLVASAMKEMGMRMRISASGGGTDANIMSGHGIEAPILATGMREVHTTNEYLELADFFNAARLAVRILGAAGGIGRNKT